MYIKFHFRHVPKLSFAEKKKSTLMSMLYNDVQKINCQE